MSRPKELVARARAAWRQGRGWAELGGDALAMALVGVFGESGAVVVVDEADEAERLARACGFFATDALQIERWPADDVRPYDGFSPAADVVAARARVRARVTRGDRPIIVADARSLMQQVPSDGTVERLSCRLAVGDEVDRDAVVQRLDVSGHLVAARVTGPGMVAVRGDIVDVWPPGRPRPVRVEWFDDEIERIRDLDPQTGRPGRDRKAAWLLPAREEPLDAEAVRRFAQHTQQAVASQGRGRRLRRRMVEELRAGIRAAGLEDWLPALAEVVPPLDLLHDFPVVVVHPQSVGASARELIRAATQRWEAMDEEERPLVTPTDRWVSPEDFLTSLDGALPVYALAGSGDAVAMDAGSVDGLAVRGGDLAPVANKLSKLASDDVRVGVVVSDGRRATALEDLLAVHGLRMKGRTHPSALREGEVGLLVGDLPRGFLAPKAGWALVPSSALFGRAARPTRRLHEHFDMALEGVHDLKEGDHVVHRLHGVGRYEGLVRLELGGAIQDVARVLYRDDDVLYVPVTGLDQLGRYTPSASSGPVTLDRLGGRTWERRKGRVRDTLLRSAQTLMRTQAKRELADRVPYPAPADLSRQVEASFPHTETPDQAQAILDVHEDLSGEHPMDRLLCGDVGFGKTEVAMRAIARVVENGRQVAVLCPTTVLAFQHHLTFQERFADLPITVGMLSRFTPADEAAAVREGLASGSVDVVVGTHALLGRSVRYRDLGLVVIDEEHRFGVKQKERLKAMRAEVDVLAMSATPIPRTLQMALTGVRPMSVIRTPPGSRLEIRTSLARFTQSRVRDAILTELERGGQVYFVHNRIETIDQVADTLASWIPEARMRVAHGRMGAETLESLYMDFVRRQFDVLISTSIIETGVDLPNVNTMLVDGADRFGLAQLHQLRGRVGRGDERGTCLLLVPEEVSNDARRRLQVLVENTRLGAGFAIATADLELRGGGNLLGESQSGAIDAVGYSVWVELLEEAIDAVRGDHERSRIEPEIEVPADAFIPDDLVPDMTRRMAWYRRFAGAAHLAEVDRLVEDLEVEVGGDLPVEVHHLAGRMRTTLLARQLGLASVRWLRVRVEVELHPSSTLDAEALERFRAEHAKRVDVVPASGGRCARVGVRFTPREEERPFLFLRWLLDRLTRAATG